jgi:hypothetical protein
MERDTYIDPQGSIVQITLEHFDINALRLSVHRSNNEPSNVKPGFNEIRVFV